MSTTRRMEGNTRADSEDEALDAACSGEEESKDGRGTTSTCREFEIFAARTGSDLQLLHFASACVSVVSSLMVYMLFWYDDSLDMLSVVEVLQYHPAARTSEGAVATTLTPTILFSIDKRLVILLYFISRSFEHCFLLIPGVYDHYEKCLKRGGNPYRWVRLGFTGALLVTIVALEVGVQDVVFLSWMAIVQLLMMTMGYMADREFQSSPSGGIPVAYGLMWATAIPTWCALFFQLWISQQYAPADGTLVDGHTLWYIGWIFVTCCTFATFQLVHFCFKVPYDKMELYEIICCMICETLMGIFSVRAFLI